VNKFILLIAFIVISVTLIACGVNEQRLLDDAGKGGVAGAVAGSAAGPWGALAGFVTGALPALIGYLRSSSKISALREDHHALDVKVSGSYRKDPSNGDTYPPATDKQ
jgi:hypothetical protein